MVVHMGELFFVYLPFENGCEGVGKASNINVQVITVMGSKGKERDNKSIVTHLLEAG